MIIQFNPNKLCKQAFFMEIVNYLYLNQPVTLREIKRQFPFQKNIDKLIEEFVKAGYIERFEKRYRLLISLVSDSSKIDLDQHFFINDDSTCYLELLNRRFVTEISNSTNKVVIIEQTSITRDDLTISNYFYKLRKNLSLTEEQNRLYNLLGDLNPEYFLKHVTTFLLKFVRKEYALQKRRNIFVDALELLGYLVQVEDGRYILNMDLDSEALVFCAKKD
ncbi:DUF1803 domain-containing protein [Streptococcus vestibularis]|nr:DUF1803 domain-containing protein [Streptococcus vestibularis]MDB6184645.1 DUF1803 domain-containing protein [Streptococcus vestibularis]MDB6201271.1 DUF1803 domain-containing protein [Streptococcus vestibularis]MDB6208665.1 DUF1803 domain-containing protein [Streptococcus vestibularis]MDB6212304.1 DUF1803 domain-containing protein [Streptococcus vestibularis]MDB6215876.1 DUF1803 domain-containing protein [Streptococcus vestibularis]